MKLFLIVTLLLNVRIAWAEDLQPKLYHIYSDAEMFDITSGAILQREDVKLLMKNFENWSWQQAYYLGISEKFVSPIIIGITPLMQRKISTRAVHFHWEPLKNLTLRPDADYYLDTGATNMSFNLGWVF